MGRYLIATEKKINENKIFVKKQQKKIYCTFSASHSKNTRGYLKYSLVLYVNQTDLYTHTFHPLQ